MTARFTIAKAKSTAQHVAPYLKSPNIIHGVGQTEKAAKKKRPMSRIAQSRTYLWINGKIPKKLHSVVLYGKITTNHSYINIYICICMYTYIYIYI